MGSDRRAPTPKGDEQLLMFLIIGILVMGSLTPSCSNGSTKGSDYATSPQSQKEIMRNPIPLRRTAQNKGERCGPRYYTDVSGDDDYNPVCYELQLKLVKASLEGDLQKMREALRDGANVEGSVYDYYPPLQTAAMQGKNEAVRLLIENGADVNRVAEFQNTPLNGAASGGHTEVIKMLVIQGADVCYRSSAGTAGDIGRAKGHKSLAELLKTAESTKCK